MNYRGRVMELSLDWGCADLRCMAAEMAAEADAEIAGLRDAFTPLADALLRLLDATEGFAVDAYAKAAARMALSRAGVEL